MTVDTLHAVAPRAWHDIAVPHLPGSTKPPSLNQEVLWLRHLDVAADPAFTISTSVRLPHAVDRGAFEEACEVVAARQPTLRTTFERTGDGGFVQRIGDRRRCPVVHHRVDEDAVADAASEVGRQRFQLLGGDLARLALFHLGDEAAVLQVAMHHAVTDWVSTQTVLREVVDAYRGLMAGEPVAATPLPVDYGDYAAWERDLLARGAWGDDIEHWAPCFSSLPVEDHGPLGLTAGRLLYEIPSEAAGRFLPFARAQRVTTFMAALVAYRLLLHWATGREDVVVGVPASARVRPEVEELVGYFLNLVPLHGTVPPDAVVGDLFAAARAETVEHMRHATVSTGALFQRFAPDVCPWRALPFRARLILLSAHEGQDPDKASLSGVDVQTGGSPYDLTLGLWAVGGAMFGRIDYRHAAFDHAQAGRLAAGLACLLAVLPDAVDRTVGQVVATLDEHVGTMRGEHR